MLAMRVVLVAAFTALATPALALAQSPVGGGYGGEGGDVQEGVAGGGSLPFTGLDLLLMVAAAALLISAGLTMRRLARAKS